MNGAELPRSRIFSLKIPLLTLMDNSGKRDRGNVTEIQERNSGIMTTILPFFGLQNIKEKYWKLYVRFMSLLPRLVCYRTVVRKPRLEASLGCKLHRFS